MWTLALQLAGASDHFDGRASTRDPARDLTDVYAWVGEEAGQSRLALVMNLHPYAGRRSRFSEDITYRLELRRASVEGTGPDTHVETGEAFRIDCHLTESRDAMRCRLEPRGAHCPSCVRVLTARIDDPAGATADGIRMYAGLRRDPFFVNTLVVSRERGRQGDKPPKRLDVTDNALVRASVLSLVFELDPSEVLGGDGMFAVAGRSVWQAYLPDTPRLGRLE
ncbi:MAG: DUF4331 family protein [Myxococcota bacterium]